MKKNLPYRLGVLIPVALISFLGWATYTYVIVEDSPPRRLLFLVGLTTVFWTYASAIWTPPGYTSVHPPTNSNVIMCLKCRRPKPERAHHCRQCGRCVLRMDHHCPWTNNCVGYANLPHFVRFLTAVVVETTYGLAKTIAWDWRLWQERHLPAYLVSRSRIAMGILLAPLQLFVLVTVGILLIRVVADTVNGQTQIEVWEQERVRAMVRRRILTKRPDPFPFDLGSPFENFSEMLGGLIVWLLPFYSMPGDGYTFKKAFTTSERWPPADSREARTHDYYRVDRWRSWEGENIADYGVDVSADEDVPLTTLKENMPI